MTNFKKATFEKIATIIMGQSPSGNNCNEINEGMPLLNGPTEFGSRFPVPTQFTTDPKRIAQKDDLLFCVRGSTTGRMNWSNREYAIGRGLAAIRHKDGTKYQPYLKALIDNNLPALLAQATGSTFPNLSKNQIGSMPIPLPDLTTQACIAFALSSYDDLIENNEKRIKILEEMAQLLYTEWFVKFKFPGHEKVKMVDSGTEYGMIPEGWKIKELGERIEIRKGKNITKSTIVEGSIPVVAGGLSPAYYHNTGNTKGPVITVSASGANAGYVNLYQEDIWASDCSYIDKDATSFVYFFFILLKSRQAEVTKLQRGSAQPHVYPKDLVRLKYLEPDQKVLTEFEEKVSKLFQMSENLINQNKKLASMRDLLIPQLVTGRRELKK